ncbi:MAG: GNAT family N-acetyltransferase [Ruthenibacterium sp.]
MNMRKIATQYLMKNRLLHIDMLEALRRGTASIVDASEDGVLLCDMSGAYLLSATTEKESARLLELVPSATVFSVHQRFSLQQIQDKFHFKSVNPCAQAAYLEKEPPTYDAENIRVLDDRYTNFVHQNYHAMEDYAYIAARIAAGDLIGAFDEDILMGFIGRHVDGSMGLLEILPQFRRRGLGVALERAEIAREIAHGDIPFCQVYCDNEASLRLQQKLGMTFANETMYLLFAD